MSKMIDGDNCPATYIIRKHIKRDVLMILGAVLLLLSVTAMVQMDRMARASYDDQVSPKVTSVFHYQIKGF